MTDAPLLDVENLTTTFETDAGRLVAVDGISFDIRRGETVCLVGESGSGKTVAAESITRLIDEPPGSVEGTVRFDGVDLAGRSPAELESIRGARIAHVFQDPQDAMNHCYTVGWQIVEAIRVHEDVPKSAARARAIDLLDRVGIANAASRVDDYPHEFSGGQKQRVMIAMALSTNPDLLIADEPTTALDVTVQARILRLLDEIKSEFGMGVLFITHDLGVVSEIADRIVVLYAGKVMERGGPIDIFERPAHPYTRQLLGCLPGVGSGHGGIPGSLPDPTDPPDGCRFAPRCEHAIEACVQGAQPEEIDLGSEHSVSCVHYHDGYDESALDADRTVPGDDEAASDTDGSVTDEEVSGNGD